MIAFNIERMPSARSTWAYAHLGDAAASAQRADRPSLAITPLLLLPLCGRGSEQPVSWVVAVSARQAWRFGKKACSPPCMSLAPL